MSDGPMSISLAIISIKSCLESDDVGAAVFLRESLLDSIGMTETWLSAEEERFLASY
ncbi:MAG: hypothetical protein VX641_01660 [Planctomycetota bacterium]|nr:hypothetical protein [Planctomycetota bacterium]